MEPWRQHLELGFAALNRKTNKTVGEVSDSMKAAMSNVECEHCQIKCFEADMLVLPCSHHHCFDCITDQLERLLGYFERSHRADIAQKFPAVLGSLMVCSRCHQISVLKKKIEFSGSLQSRDRGALGRVVFTVDKEKTKTISSKCEVKCFFENQRRLMGKFSKRNLFPIERGPATRVDSEANQKVDLDTIDAELTASKKIWLEDWEYDKSCGNPQGWQYGPVTWPVKNVGWVLEPSLGTFVRRRLMLRCCIEEAVLQELAKN